MFREVPGFRAWYRHLIREHQSGRCRLTGPCRLLQDMDQLDMMVENADYCEDMIVHILNVEPIRTTIFMCLGIPCDEFIEDRYGDLL